MLYGNSGTQAGAIGDAISAGLRRVGMFFGAKLLTENSEKAKDMLSMVGISVDGEKAGKTVAIAATALQLGTTPGSGSDMILGIIGDLAAVNAGISTANNKLIAAKEAEKQIEAAKSDSQS